VEAVGGLYKQAQVQALLLPKLARQERETKVLELEQQAQEKRFEKLGRQVLAQLFLEPEPWVRVRVPDRTGQMGHECGGVGGNSRASIPIAGSSLAERQWPW